MLSSLITLLHNVAAATLHFIQEINFRADLIITNLSRSWTQHCNQIILLAGNVSSVSFALLYLIIVGKPLPPLKWVVPTSQWLDAFHAVALILKQVVGCFAPNVEHATPWDKQPCCLPHPQIFTPGYIRLARFPQPLSHRRILLLCRKRDDRASKPLEKGVCIRYTRRWIIWSCYVNISTIFRSPLCDRINDF